MKVRVTISVNKVILKVRVRGSSPHSEFTIMRAEDIPSDEPLDGETEPDESELEDGEETSNESDFHRDPPPPSPAALQT